MKARTVSKIIEGLYAQLIDSRFSSNKHLTENHGILFSVGVHSECLGYEKDGNTHHPEWCNSFNGRLNIIITTRRKVFIALGDYKLSIISVKCLPDLSTWENVSNHDSCWKDAIDSALVDVCFNAHDEAFKNCPKELKPQTRDSAVDLDLSTSIGGQVFKLVKVVHEADPEQDSSYFRKLTAVEFVKETLEV